MGVQNLEKFNVNILCKSWWNLLNKEGVWKDIVKRKYKLQNWICQVKSTVNDSPCWADLMKLKQIHMGGRIMIIGNGMQTDFWNDCWCGQIALKDQFLEFFFLQFVMRYLLV